MIAVGILYTLDLAWPFLLFLISMILIIQPPLYRDKLHVSNTTLASYFAAVVVCVISKCAHTPASGGQRRTLGACSITLHLIFLRQALLGHWARLAARKR